MADEKLTLKIYGDPEKVIHYMDYTETPAVDNSSYIPDLVPGMLQPLEVYEDDSVSDEVLSNLDIEAIVKEAELSIGTPNVDSPNMEKQLKWFPEPSDSSEVTKFSKKNISSFQLFLASIEDLWLQMN